MEKNCVLNQLITHSPSLFDDPEKKAYASEKLNFFDKIYEVLIVEMFK